ncbi:hypothetical protein [Jannaschia sp. CCS1]|uniref:hypothetical protein n=1 Tax=Jannaschia sp. (strain CCS1) TaxID=290400 RepID=UPI000053B809|nr:hypothetical protein [Jannaschia sp. CCS1]ABD52954.1 hypothetical protein Jann_0037 [Jannaschia sp. CCS1]
MKKIAIIAALAASIAAPAAAQSTSTAFAIAHFNMSAERQSDIIPQPSGNLTTSVVSTRGNGALAEAFQMFNQTADNPGELRGVNQATVVSSASSARAQDIFARLRAESREDAE